MKPLLFIVSFLVASLVTLQAQIYTPSGTIQGSSGSDNVGIGVSDPDTKLEINGGLKIETDVAELRLASTHTGGQRFVLRSHIGGVTYAGFEIFDEANNLNRLTISQDGKIGFGITTPEAKLHIHESMPLGSVSGNYQIVSIQNATPNNNFYKKEYVFRESNGNDWTTASWFDGIDIDGAFPVPMTNIKCWYKRTPYGDNTLRHAWGNGSSTFMGISSNGNVGIGTANPYRKLHIFSQDTPGTYYDGELQVGGFVGTTDDVTMSIGTNYTNKTMFIQGWRAGYGAWVPLLLNPIGSNVGIGTTSPSAKLQVGSNISDTGSQTVRISTEVGGSGTITDALHLDAGPGSSYDQGLSLSFGLKHSYYGEYTSRIVHYGYSGATRESKLQLQTHSVDAGVWNTGILIDNLGNVGVGKTNPGNYRLNVDGRIRADEVVVNNTGADFVFDKGYRLRSLSEVESFIKENSHLPDIQSAAEMTENGMNLSEMQTKLLQKIEEMTLYLIELKKENIELRERIEMIESN